MYMHAVHHCPSKPWACTYMGYCCVRVLMCGTNVLLPTRTAVLTCGMVLGMSVRLARMADATVHKQTRSSNGRALSSNGEPDPKSKALSPAARTVCTAACLHLICSAETGTSLSAYARAQSYQPTRVRCSVRY